MRPFTAALTAVTILVAVVALATSITPRSEGGSTESHVRELYTFDTTAPMVAASDLVVIGTISASAPGRAVGDERDPNDNLVFTEVRLEVDEVIAGLADDVIVLEIDDSLIPREGRWDVPGTAVLLFLHERSDRPGTYRPTNTQGVFIVDGDRLTPAVVDDDFTQSFAGIGRPDALRQLREAADAVTRGDVTPPPPALGGGREPKT